MRASILAIGTELTTGQIVNRNSPWISERLARMGVEVVLHHTVADDRKEILRALEHCASGSELLFVTGGLGPTTDDFTRDVVAQWCGKELHFHEPSWVKIEKRLGAFGIPVANSNRQQCFFPDGAAVIANVQGTADGFALKHKSVHAWILPGPPIEVEAIWTKGKSGSGIEKDILEIAPELEPMVLKTWQCMGKSEAELGEITEAALAGSGLLIGYRAHRPFVEVKVWCPQSAVSKNEKWFAKLELAIRPWIHTRQGEDLAAKVLSQLVRSEEIEIIDSGSGGILNERLAPLLRSATFQSQAQAITIGTEWTSPDSPEEWVQHLLAQADDDVLTLAFAGFTEDGRWSLGLKHGQTVRSEVLRSPYPKLLDRSRPFAVEMALKKWSEWLEEATV